MPPRLRRAALAAALLIAPPAGYAGTVYLTGNVHEVEPGILYRAGQLGPSRLDDLVRSKGIRSILNLRGDHPDQAWWRDETRVAASNGVAYRSIAISARSVPDMATMNEIAQAMRDAPKPLLVHCIGGSDRSGLAAAIYRLAVDGAAPDVAADQLSILYGHFPWLGSRTYAMDEAFTRFAAAWTSTAPNAPPAGAAAGDGKTVEAETRP